MPRVISREKGVRSVEGGSGYRCAQRVVRYATRPIIAGDRVGGISGDNRINDGDYTTKLTWINGGGFPDHHQLHVEEVGLGLSVSVREQWARGLRSIFRLNARACTKSGTVPRRSNHVEFS